MPSGCSLPMPWPSSALSRAAEILSTLTTSPAQLRLTGLFLMISARASEMTSTPRYYTGIGSRETPPEALQTMARCARWLAEHGLVLRSGGAPGADTAFESGVDQADAKVIYVPWDGFQGHPLVFKVPPVTDRRNRATDVRHIGARNRWVERASRGVTPGWILRAFAVPVLRRLRSAWESGTTGRPAQGSRRCGAAGPGSRWPAAGWPGRPGPTR